MFLWYYAIVELTVVAKVVTTKLVCSPLIIVYNLSLLNG